jgi:hypothetical protein
MPKPRVIESTVEQNKAERQKVKNGMSDIKATPEIEKAIRGLYVKGKGFLPMSVCGYCRDCKWLAGSTCTSAEMAGGKLTNPETKAIARDMEKWNAYLEVSPDFGCVQFDAIESEG